MPLDHNDHQERIFVASDFQLVNRGFYRTRIWGPARELTAEIGGVSKWTYALTMLYEVDERLYHSIGGFYPLAEIDEVFGQHAERWMRNFLEADESNQAPARYTHLLERLRLIELYCRLIKDQPWASA
ncbi:MAG: hypothetical protein AAF367_19405 [Pseudomonadota bacterium]